MSDIQQELAACRESAEIGYQLAQESFDKLKDALAEEREKLREADRRQQSSRLENDRIFRQQLGEMDSLERETVSRVEDNLRDLKKKMSDFTIVLYGRTMAGKSTLMEILCHGDGSSIGKGAQRTTRDVRAYTWNGLKIFDVPGTCSFGGAGDDRLAFEAAKDADIALFLLTDDAPQPSEAQRLAELKRLGKPVLGIVNVKQVLSPDRASAKRKMDLRQLDKKIHDQSRLEEIVRQFKEFSQKNGYNFEDVPFVYSHLQSAFFSQRENDASLYELSNFAAVESFILDKVQQDGKFIRIKTFIDTVARPIQYSIAQLYHHSAESIRAHRSYCDKIKELKYWRENFVKRCNNRIDNLIQNLAAQLDAKINYIANNYYYSFEKAERNWHQAINELNINQQCQNFIVGIDKEVATKLHEFTYELEKDLRYAGGSFNSSDIFYSPSILFNIYKFIDTATIVRILGGSPLVAIPLMWTILFGPSDSEKREIIRSSFRESCSEIISKIEASIHKIIQEEILAKQIDEFQRKLEAMNDMLKKLACSQNVIADTTNIHYHNLNFELLMYAMKYSNINPKEFMKIRTARIVGEKFIIVNSTWISGFIRNKISKLIGEKILYFISNGDDRYFDDIMENVRVDILRNQFKRILFVTDADTGDMYVITLARSGNLSDSQIELAQQLFSDPVVFD